MRRRDGISAPGYLTGNYDQPLLLAWDLRKSSSKDDAKDVIHSSGTVSSPSHLVVIASVFFLTF